MLTSLTWLTPVHLKVTVAPTGTRCVLGSSTLTRIVGLTPSLKIFNLNNNIYAIHKIKLKSKTKIINFGTKKKENNHK